MTGLACAREGVDQHGPKREGYKQAPRWPVDSLQEQHVEAAAQGAHGVIQVIVDEACSGERGEGRDRVQAGLGHSQELGQSRMTRT